MATKFYRKGAVGTNLLLPSGHYVRFTKVDINTEVFGTEDENIQNELAKLVGKRAGLEEIGKEEYETLKKNKDSKPVWREELRNEDLKRGLASNRAKPSSLFDKGGPIAAAPVVGVDNFEDRNRAAVGLVNPPGQQQNVPLARPKASGQPKAA